MKSQIGTAILPEVKFYLMKIEDYKNLICFQSHLAFSVSLNSEEGYYESATFHNELHFVTNNIQRREAIAEMEIEKYVCLVYCADKYEYKRLVQFVKDRFIKIKF